MRPLQRTTPSGNPAENRRGRFNERRLQTIRPKIDASASTNNAFGQSARKSTRPLQRTTPSDNPPENRRVRFNERRLQTIRPKIDASASTNNAFEQSARKSTRPLQRTTPSGVCPTLTAASVENASPSCATALIWRSSKLIASSPTLKPATRQAPSASERTNVNSST